mmetsp:Transcript_19130/g.31715  ORF Transcript_19130/g.31715 Transcript_19130/m.31715 type:complete len:200 (-) Transcript_19130:96-695(-)
MVRCNDGNISVDIDMLWSVLVLFRYNPFDAELTHMTTAIAGRTCFFFRIVRALVAVLLTTTALSSSSVSLLLTDIFVVVVVAFETTRIFPDDGFAAAAAAAWGCTTAVRSCCDCCADSSFIVALLLLLLLLLMLLVELAASGFPMLLGNKLVKATPAANPTNSPRRKYPICDCCVFYYAIACRFLLVAIYLAHTRDASN